jgi:2-phospho-L-lactate transferase/gluconeogenesis factor (CofD/UPF0052 family)
MSDARFNVVLFSGGSGTHTITEALWSQPQIRLRILINAYDDGHSTGRLRKFVASMLGPSDVRKNISRLMPVAERCQQSLRSLSDSRLPVGIAQADALKLLDAMVEGKLSALPPKMAAAFRQLTIEQSGRLRSLLSAFVTYFREQEPAGETFDFTDCALGNLLFAGCYLQQGCDFNRTIQVFSRYYEVPSDALLNITQGENLYLVAVKEDGSVLRGEAEIAAAQTQAKISELYLVDALVYRSSIDGAEEPAGGWLPLLRESARAAKISPAAAEAIAEADVIVYGPGTQHSSLLPSYMTEGVGEAIAANRNAEKVFIGNILRDVDIQEDDFNDLARKFMHAMTRNGALAIEWRECVTHFFVQRPELEDASHTKYIPFDPSNFMYPLDTVRVRDWEVQDGRHSGGFVLDELKQIAQSRPRGERS